jgi:serralysin
MTNEKNYYCMCPGAESLTGNDAKTAQGVKAAVLNGVKWPDGSRLTIKFLEGSPALQQRVIDVAKIWTTLANISFEFVDEDDAQIRIAFQPGRGSWSYLGTVAENIPPDEPTMNYGWLRDDSTDDEVRRVVLHEFGHVLGLIHEHQNPLHGIDWNRDAVIQDLGGPPNNWTIDTIENNMFHKYDPAEVSASPVDKDSIMMYPIPLAWTRDGFSAGLNTNLTDTDKAIIRQAYP